jgi:hypothetical protein
VSRSIEVRKDLSRLKPLSPSRLEPPSRIAALAALILSFGLVWWTGRAPEPRPLESPAGEFAADRARQVQARLLGSGLPHPTASPENAAVRERVVAELRALGLEPQVQEIFACSPEAICGTVYNVVARIDGSGKRGVGIARQGAVLLATHYDSVAAGAGASDAAASSAAVVEIARALLATRAAAPLPRDVILLIDDGEEVDLLGAEGFLRHPWFAEVGAVVNLEARGTEGQSFWFETAPGNAEVVAAVTPALDRPATSSTFIEIYRRMPNDTDFSVFRRVGLQGVNLAFIGGGTRYHTPLDDLAHSSAASLEHQGRNGLAAVRALASRPGEAPISGAADAVFFDVLSRFVVRWPAGVGWALGLIAVGLVFVAAARFSESIGIGAALLGLCAAVAMPVAAGAGAELVRRLVIAIGAAPRPWIASPRPLLVAVWAMAIAGVAFAAWAFARRAGAAGTWFGTWFVWSAAGLTLALQVPGVSYLFLVPALTAGLIATVTRRPVAALPALVAGVLWWGLALRLYGALGVPLLAATGAVVGLVVATTAAAWSRPGSAIKWMVMGLGAAFALAGAIFLKVLPHSTPQVPERLNLLAYDEAESVGGGGSGGSRLYALPESGSLPREFSSQGSWSPVQGKLFPWSARDGGGFGRQLAEPTPAAPPSAEIVSAANLGALRKIELRLRSARGAPIVTLWLPPGFAFEKLTVNGVAPPPPTERSSLAPADRWRAITVVGGPAAGSLLTFEVPSSALPADLWLADRLRELPPAAAQDLARRPERAVRSHGGDGWVVATRVVLPAAEVVPQPTTGAAPAPIINPEETRR